eukprot:CAMPEP_0170517482 /NCGR_PEP_ID=MMETSP0209-20121228/3466_1 /TAXON_ID=665100 ORGANISM="Litonotus pictus, Strain P1" /NCGR_SAMPLE_ID=MMETSP0209 /ASSEMBLY_ACC=CAM_ASM_000301 /LENGTH=449 /DNA_ID=CAMNT_0010802753 /DNA_START=96 /DNA_END=1445 /DNA_ORIENTATION=-
MFIELSYKHPFEEEAPNIFFVIHLVANYPFNVPRVFCKSGFSYPIIADGRDLLEEVLGQTWTTGMKLIDVAEKIPAYISDFLTNLQEGNIYLSGSYTLGEKYDLSLLEQLPVYLQKIKEKVNINGKDKEFTKIMLVGDMFFCLFDQDMWNRNNLTLTFWSNIRALVTIKKTIQGETCRFFWKQKNRKKMFEQILLIPEDSNKLIDLLLSKMKNFGINYKITRNNNEPRKGKIPSVDIDSVEKSIARVEEDVKLKPDAVHVEYLLELYSIAVEYYSATNNPLYEVYKQKTQDIMKSENLTNMVDKEIIEAQIQRDKQHEEKSKASDGVSEVIIDSSNVEESGERAEGSEQKEEKNEGIRTEEVKEDKEEREEKKEEEIIDKEKNSDSKEQKETKQDEKNVESKDSKENAQTPQTETLPKNEKVGKIEIVDDNELGNEAVIYDEESEEEDS